MSNADDGEAAIETEEQILKVKRQYCFNIFVSTVAFVIFSIVMLVRREQIAYHWDNGS